MKKNRYCTRCQCTTTHEDSKEFSTCLKCGVKKEYILKEGKVNKDSKFKF